MCGCECCITDKNMNSYLLTWRDFNLKNPRHKSQHANQKVWQNWKSKFETHKNSVRTHSCHIHNTAVDMSTEIMYPCTAIHHMLPYWKCMLLCCDKCPNIFIPIQEENKDKTNTCTTIRFNIYINVLCCTVNGRRPYYTHRRR